VKYRKVFIVSILVELTCIATLLSW